MLIKKYKHGKNISNNIQIKQPSSSPLSDELTPSTATETVAETVTVTEATCNNSAADLRHLFLKHYTRWYTGRQQQEPKHHPRTRTRTRTTSMWCLPSVIVVLGVISLPLPPHCDAVGYSYTRFSGPVSGPEHRVYVRDGAGAGQRVADGTDDDHDEATRLDYVAKPEYEFAYGVEDAQAHILHNRNEMRDGDAVKGVYSVVDPDGTLRVVKYTADDINGFQAEVIMNGISAIHGQLQPDTPTTIAHTNSNNNNNDYYQSTPNEYSPEVNSNYNHHYHPSYYYPTPVRPENPSATTHPSNYNNNDYDDTQEYEYNNEGDYRPQYEVHERPNNVEEADKEDGDDEYDGKDDNKKVSNGGKKKDYDEEDDDDDDDGDDYDNSEELEDYDEAVKNHEASDESDEYY